MALEEYRQKRSFNKTPEPTGGSSEEKHLQFVVQKHHASHLHYDFRLELRGVLKSWAVPKGPSMNPEDHRFSTLVEDHPFDYKNFEGIIPKGNYGAGTVIIWDEGRYLPEESTGNKKEDEKTLVKQFYSGKMNIILRGKKLKGAFHLFRTPERGENAWLLVKANDQYAKKIDISKKDKSVVSGLNLEQMAANANARQWQSNRSSNGKLKKQSAKEREEEIKDILPAEKDYTGILKEIKGSLRKQAKTDMPRKVEPMYATLMREPFDDKDWEFEIKWDGYRTIAYVEKGKVTLKSRSNQSFNFYTPVADALKDFPVNAVFDGEIVVLDEEGKSDFTALQKWQRDPSGLLVYYVFDILWLDGIDLRSLALTKRKEILKKIIPETDIIRFSDSVDEVGKEFFELAKKNKLEGIVGKKKSSHYQQGKRGKDWLKFPTANRQEFVIGGWTESSSGRKFKSILFGYYDQQGKLIYFGHAGHGFKENEMPALLDKFKQYESKKSPFANADDRTEDKVHYMKPELIGVFEYKTVTSGGKIRHPAVFFSFREDKVAEEVVKEEPADKPVNKKPASSRARKKDSDSESNWPIIEKQKITSSTAHNFEGKEVILTNIEKPLWQGVTKAHLLMYYHAVYPYIIPHLRKRPLSLHIKHISPNVPGLYIKDMEGKGPSWAEIFTVERKHKKKGKRDEVDYLVCNDEATLQYIINLGCIDVNPWTSTTDDPRQPDFIIIDLDPSDDDFKKAIDAAKAAKEFFDKHKLIAFPKTSGKTGIHLYLPCAGFTFEQARTIAENICSGIHDLVPSITTTEVSINQRGDRLYLDPNQNDFADTVAAPYSVRPYHHPSVSAPLQWKEVNNNLDPLKYDINTMVARLDRKGDLFEDVLLPQNKTKNSKGLKKFL